jgi:hypothetical protein
MPDGFTCQGKSAATQWVNQTICSCIVLTFCTVIFTLTTLFPTIGKMFGLENNYYVAEVDYREGGLEEEEDEEVGMINFFQNHVCTVKRG